MGQALDSRGRPKGNACTNRHCAIAFELHIATATFVSCGAALTARRRKRNCVSKPDQHAPGRIPAHREQPTRHGTRWRSHRDLGAWTLQPVSIVRCRSECRNVFLTSETHESVEPKTPASNAHLSDRGHLRVVSSSNSPMTRGASGFDL